MSDLPNYTISLSATTTSYVGYVPQEDAIVEYWIERNYIFYCCPPKMGTTLGVCPIENMNTNRIIPLGEL
jgi:hypothetical protein